MLTALVLILSQVPPCGGVEVGNPGGYVCENVKRSDHGWLTLLEREKWELVSIRTTKKNADGLCAKESERGLLAMRGGALKAGAVEGVTVQADLSECRLARASVTVQGTTWTFSGREISSDKGKWLVPLASMCWTAGWLGDLDADGVADLIVSRSGAGVVTSLFLSATGTVTGPKASLVACGTVNVAPL